MYGPFRGTSTNRESAMLVDIAKSTDGFSGRTLRKLPLLAFVKCARISGGAIEIEDFLKMLMQAAHDHRTKLTIV